MFLSCSCNWPFGCCVSTSINKNFIFIIIIIIIIIELQAVGLAAHLKQQSSPVTDLEWPRGFQEVKVPTFHDNGTGWW